jgi:hypothetical protein
MSITRPAKRLRMPAIANGFQGTSLMNRPPVLHSREQSTTAAMPWGRFESAMCTGRGFMDGPKDARTG